MGAVIVLIVVFALGALLGYEYGTQRAKAKAEDEMRGLRRRDE